MPRCMRDSSRLTPAMPARQYHAAQHHAVACRIVVDAALMPPCHAAAADYDAATIFRRYFAACRRRAADYAAVFDYATLRMAMPPDTLMPTPCRFATIIFARALFH